MKFDTVEYSVCEDCFMSVAHVCENDHDIEAAVARELNGRKGHFCTGVASTEDDPDGTGYDEFSHAECELCRSALGGARYGVTLLLEQERAAG